MQLQTTSPESKFPNEYSDVIFIQIDQHLKQLLQKYKGVPILWNTVYTHHYHFLAVIINSPGLALINNQQQYFSDPPCIGM